jgi:DNA-binding SARP family transcriptional activator/tetratricopeptide (TPR) repeat protein
MAGSMLLAGPLGRIAMNPLPIQPVKIHRPPLRHDVLSRERLNGWLDGAVGGRVALVIAEAGFGKTTLLADWARHTRRATAWYRLESDDRDWLAFIRHLVSTGREIDPVFAPETYELLLSLGPGGPSRDDLTARIASEIGEFASSLPDGLSLLFDDYHAVDGSPETEPIMRALLEQTGPSFSMVIAARTAPSLPLGHIRSRGAVSRIDGDALCFTVPEAERLFRDAYHQPLDQDVVMDLIDRTQGWPALVALVHANLESRSPGESRGLVRSLSGAAGDLRDYLTEAVLGHVPQRLADFLVRASILECIEPDTASMLGDASRDDSTRMIREAEELGLLTGSGVDGGRTFVPLVQDYLLARLERELGPDWIRDKHLALGAFLAPTAWRLAAHHYRGANAPELAGEVIQGALSQILGSGQYRAAADLLAGTDEVAVVGEVLRSRLLLQVGAASEAREAAHAAVHSAETLRPDSLSVSLLNAATISLGARQYEEALRYAQRAVAESSGSPSRELAHAYAAILGASGTGSLPALAAQLERLLASQRKHAHWHHAAITSLNLAQVLVLLDRNTEALGLSVDAERFLARSSQGYELVSVRLAQAHAEAHLGRWTRAQALLETALGTAHPEGQAEAVLEAGSLAAWFGPHDLPGRILSSVRREYLPADWGLHWMVLDLWLAESRQRRDEILARLPDKPSQSLEVGASFRWHLTKARAYLSQNDMGKFVAETSQAEAVAEAQRSPTERRLASLMRAIGTGPDEASRVVESWSPEADPFLGVLASEIVATLSSLSGVALMAITRAATASPHRWREPLRAEMSRVGFAGRCDQAAALLEQIGEPADVPILRNYGRGGKRSGRTWGEELSRRLAPRAIIEDLGPISILIGDRIVDGRGIRRKVLALLAFLVSQPNGSATPDRVMDALWPELDPEQGSNSIHQTIYFLRRVIDPGYRAGVSPEYLHFDSETIWIDSELVSCRSWRCQGLLNERPATPALVDELIANYRGRFASDFPYEDWASSYRDNLHARFLAEVERAMGGDRDGLDLRWRLWVGQQALAIDPEADEIEAQVVRLYRRLGSPAAAAEQYAHYASVLREQLGVEPPRIEDL